MIAALLAVAASAQAEPRSSTFGVFDVPNDRRALGALDALAVGWVRQQIQLGDPEGTRRMRVFQRLVPTLIQREIGLWITFYHRDGENVVEQGTVGFRASKRGGFPFAAIGRYQRLVEQTVAELAQLVRRGGGDPAQYLVIQFGNEVVPRDLAPPDRPIRFWHGTGDEYLALLSAGYDAVKNVDPRIPVASAGISSAAMEQVLAGQARIENWYVRLLREGKADWADIHLRHQIDTITPKVAWLRQHWTGPIASTEVAGPDPRTDTYSESAQARDLPQRLSAALSAGVARVFWAGLAENPAVEPIYRHEGLIERGSFRRKPAFEAYRALIAEAR